MFGLFDKPWSKDPFCIKQPVFQWKASGRGPLFENLIWVLRKISGVERNDFFTCMADYLASTLGNKIWNPWNWENTSLEAWIFLLETIIFRDEFC